MFEFRLERVLQHRQRQVDACTLEVAEAQAALLAASSRLDALDRELDDSRNLAAARRRGEIRTVDLQRQLGWHENLLACRQRLAAEVTAARAVLEAAKARLEEAWRDREVLERLKQRQREEWLRLRERRERQDLDEIGAIRAALALRETAFSGTGRNARGGPQSAESDRP